MMLKRETGMQWSSSSIWTDISREAFAVPKLFSKYVQPAEFPAKVVGCYKWYIY